eukprot:TRINITY_DN16268_c0_g1_i1.p2 TRINITY_DN16268_c0_g1~~TRINITY_DN16268_c0_g1_i1.p2  ORF type:complete len:104 (-),score=5.19 TRINITY_DN16268_c0_g1_i1:20-331(-)
MPSFVLVRVTVHRVYLLTALALGETFVTVDQVLGPDVVLQIHELLELASILQLSRYLSRAQLQPREGNAKTFRVSLRGRSCALARSPILSNTVTSLSFSQMCR